MYLQSTKNYIIIIVYSHSLCSRSLYVQLDTLFVAALLLLPPPEPIIIHALSLDSWLSKGLAECRSSGREAATMNGQGAGGGGEDDEEEEEESQSGLVGGRMAKNKL